MWQLFIILLDPLSAGLWSEIVQNPERKQLEKTLWETEAKFRTIFELSSEAIVLLDTKGKVLDANARLYEWLGHKPEEVIGRNLLDLSFLPQESKTGVIEDLLQRVVGEETSPCELDFVTRSGEERVGRIVSNLMRDEYGEVTQAIVMITDITDYRKTKEALQESMQREARAYAQGRLEILDTMLHNIGNAINSVTVGIGTIQENLANNKLTRRLLSLANVVREHQDDFGDYVKNDPRGQQVAPFIIALADDFVRHNEELAKTVNRVSERAAHIIDITRIESPVSTRNVYTRIVNLREAIYNALTVLKDPIGENHIEISVDCDNAPEEISMQEARFHQMLVDLIKNSIEAIRDLEMAGGQGNTPFIRIHCYLDSDSLIIKITDNGIGIEKGNLDVIFRPGYTTKGSESGLGLHSVANFVDACRGHIRALSDGIGEGATMRVALPLSSIAL
jgi:two-component system NtrC family sensor kinase